MIYKESDFRQTKAAYDNSLQKTLICGVGVFGDEVYAASASVAILLAAKLVGEEVSAPSPTLQLREGEMAAVITADLESYEKRHDEKPVRKTVSLPQWMAKEAEKKKISLSKALQETLKARLAD